SAARFQRLEWVLLAPLCWDASGEAGLAQALGGGGRRRARAVGRREERLGGGQPAVERAQLVERRGGFVAPPQLAQRRHQVAQAMAIVGLERQAVAPGFDCLLVLAAEIVRAG